MGGGGMMTLDIYSSSSSLYIMDSLPLPLLALFAFALFAVHHTSWTQMVSCVVSSAGWDLSFNITGP
jgi:hypothetical protein